MTESENMISHLEKMTLSDNDSSAEEAAVIKNHLLQAYAHFNDMESHLLAQKLEDAVLALDAGVDQLSALNTLLAKDAHRREVDKAMCAFKLLRKQLSAK